jgi:hypothetical protein
MARRRSCEKAGAFGIVKTVGLGLPHVEAATRYDGSSVLKLDGCFMAGLATHRSAEPDTLVVRVGVEDRGLLIEDAPETYYVTDYYQRYPLVLVRLSRVDRDALRDLLSMSWQLTAAKARRAGGIPRQRELSMMRSPTGPSESTSHRARSRPARRGSRDR